MLLSLLIVEITIILIIVCIYYLYYLLLTGDLLCCDGPCGRVFHINCVGLETAPPEDEKWHCEDCDSLLKIMGGSFDTKPSPYQGKKRKKKQEIKGFYFYSI